MVGALAAERSRRWGFYRWIFHLVGLNYCLKQALEADHWENPWIYIDYQHLSTSNVGKSSTYEWETIRL